MKKKTVKNLPLIALGVCAAALAGSMLVHSRPGQTIRRWWIDPETGVGGWVE